MKFESKISYLGKKISILPWQMAEQLAVEVNVKQAKVQQCLAQHNLAKLSLNCVYVVARIMVRL